MATFSTNQVRQFYVATAFKTPHVIESDTAGAIAVSMILKETPVF